MTRPACADARRGLAYYIRRTNEWRHKMGAGERVSEYRTAACPQIRRAAKLWRSRAHRARLAYGWWYLYAWRDWMPAFWQGIARCEEHYNFAHRAGAYTSTFAISIAEYDKDAAYMGAPGWFTRHTPRDQYLAALGHQRRFGLNGWGCYTNGGYR